MKYGCTIAQQTSGDSVWDNSVWGIYLYVCC